VLAAREALPQNITNNERQERTAKVTCPLDHRNHVVAEYTGEFQQKMVEVIQRVWEGLKVM
jgi:hypothetical protein